MDTVKPGDHVALCQEQGQINAFCSGRVADVSPTGQIDPFLEPVVVVDLDGIGRWEVPICCIGDPPEKTFESMLPGEFLPLGVEGISRLVNGLYVFPRRE